MPFAHGPRVTPKNDQDDAEFQRTIDGATAGKSSERRNGKGRKNGEGQAKAVPAASEGLGDNKRFSEQSGRRILAHMKVESAVIPRTWDQVMECWVRARLGPRLAGMATIEMVDPARNEELRNPYSRR